MKFPNVEFLKSLTDQEKAQWLVDNNLPVYGQYGIDTMAEIIAILEKESMAAPGVTEHLEKIGRIAYEGYCEYTDGKSLISGQPLPKWEDLRREIRNAWECSACTVEDYLDEKRRNSEPRS